MTDTSDKTIIIRCPACRGVKKIIGLGLISRDCKACAGIGHTRVAAVAETPKKTRSRKSGKSTPKIEAKAQAGS